MGVPTTVRCGILAALVVTGGAALAAPEPKPAAPPPATVLDLGLAFAIPRDEQGLRVVDDAWVSLRIAEANRLWAPAGVRFRWTRDEELPSAQREAHTRDDRDALAPLVIRGHVRIVVVTQLEDVDEPGRLRMGVCWTSRKDRSRYVLLATTSFPAVLAHELGHYLGNPHVPDADNLMSYQRTGGEIFVDASQTARARATAGRLLASGVLVDVGPPRLVP